MTFDFENKNSKEFLKTLLEVSLNHKNFIKAVTTSIKNPNNVTNIRYLIFEIKLFEEEQEKINEKIISVALDFEKTGVYEKDFYNKILTSLMDQVNTMQIFLIAVTKKLQDDTYGVNLIAYTIAVNELNLLQSNRITNYINFFNAIIAKQEKIEL